MRKRTKWILSCILAGAMVSTSFQPCNAAAEGSLASEETAFGKYGDVQITTSRENVPAKNSSGRVGLYDLLNDRFIYHASLIAGPAV